MLGIKQQVQNAITGVKMIHSGYSLGQKMFGSRKEAQPSGNADINKQDSVVVESQNMPTGIDKTKQHSQSKSNLERGNSKR